MKRTLVAIVLSISLVLTGLLIQSVYAGQRGKMKYNTMKTQTQTMTGQQIRNRQRLRDGSCVTQSQTQSGAMNRKGKTYGPGDGTGNDGIGPRDGTGYGAPAQR
jgi:hypothetical protein